MDNILLITTDQQRFDTIHSVNNPYILTPHLDYIADQGCVFLNCYTDCPICMPSRASIMNGQAAYHHKQIGNGGDSPIDPHNSLPGILSRHGYQTRAQGKMHFAPLRATYGFEQMEILDDYYRYMARHPEKGVPANHGLGQNEVYPAISTVHETHSLTRWIVARSIDFLETRDPTRPFFLWSSFSKPHPPFDPAFHFFQLYANKEVPYPVYGNWSQSFEDVPVGLKQSSYILNNLYRMTDEQIIDMRRAYYACITQIDYTLGILLARMRELHILENTWIIFTSDHGDMLADHHLGSKTVFNEGSAHVPFIIMPPSHTRAKMPRSIDKIVSLVDLFPSILEMAGIPPQEDLKIDGISLLNSEIPQRTLLGTCEKNHLVLDYPYKYQYTQWEGAEQLFNLQKDPLEQNNLLLQTEHKSVHHAMRALMASHLSAIGCDVSGGFPWAVHVPADPDAVVGSFRLRGLWPGFHSIEAVQDVVH